MLPRSFKEFSVTDVRNKLVLITGACGGFGEHMVTQFLDRDCRLIVTDVDESRIAALINKCRDRNGQILSSFSADLSTPTGCADLYTHCEQQQLIPDILINNAGIALAGRHEQVPQERWEELLNLNLFAPMRISGQFLPKMLQRASGHIVNISSLAGWVGAPNLSVYVASKFGLRGFGESLAAEAAKSNVRVSNVYPSFSRTPILDSDQFGMGKRIPIPDKMISDPADVVAKIIKGIERDRLHIFPDNIALRIHYLKRFVPWAIPLFSRKMPIHE